MKVLISIAAVAILFLVGGFLGAIWWPLGWVFGVLLPYMALLVFVGGLVYRVVEYANIPVPFRIPTTCGQQKSLPWIKRSRLDNPSDALGVVGRMFLEITLFRSLFRNPKTQLLKEGRLVYQTKLGLWIGALAFHWCLLLVLVRHLRFFTNPVPKAVGFLQAADGFLEVGLPVFYVTTVVFLAALAYLLVRRLIDAQVRYISLLDDYFLLCLLLGIGLSGFFLRHVFKADITGVKELALGLAMFRPALPGTISELGMGNMCFFGHLFLVCSLMTYFPFSKLLHMPGVFLSPTRNLANNNRSVRHVNPWDYPVKTHSYEEYEDEWRDKMKACGVPVDKE